MADEGAPSTAPSGDPAGDPTANPLGFPMDDEFIMKFRKTIEVLAGSYRSEPQKDKKPQKKKPTNPKVENLKKQSFEEKKKLKKTTKKLRIMQLLELKQNTVKRLEKRKSLIEKDEQVIRSLDEKLVILENE